MVLVWQTCYHSPSLPNFTPSKHSRYTVTHSTALSKYCGAIFKGTLTSIYLIIHVISRLCHFVLYKGGLKAKNLAHGITANASYLLT